MIMQSAWKQPVFNKEHLAETGSNQEKEGGDIEILSVSPLAMLLLYKRVQPAGY